MPTNVATLKLGARISTDLHTLLKHASEVQGRTKTNFVVTTVHRTYSENRCRISRLNPGDSLKLAKRRVRNYLFFPVSIL
ncbi:MAG: DUF1778 domain-containing protein [Actinobacteria bacterium]|nr:DUF1778 domain-containing protein [Actinomycetota bacterium]